MSLRYNQTKQSKTQYLRWRVIYDDDTELWELDPYKQIEHSFVEIDQSRIKYFDLIPPAKDQEDMEYFNTDIKVKNHDDNPSILTFKIYHKVMPPIMRIFLDVKHTDKRLIFVRRTQKTGGRKIALLPIKKKETIKDKKTGKLVETGKIIDANFSIVFPTSPGGMVILVGWQKSLDGCRNIQAINVMYPDGKVELIDKWQDDAIHKKPEPVSNIAKQNALKRVEQEKERVAKIWAQRHPKAVATSGTGVGAIIVKKEKADLNNSKST